MPSSPSLKNRRDFRRVRADGRKGRSDGIVVFALPSDRTRLGLAVRSSGGRARGAVVRNRARRRVREAFRAHDVRGFEVVVSADRGVAGVDFQELVEHMGVALRAAGAKR